MAKTETRLVDEVPYADPDDILPYLRNRDSWDELSSPTVEQIHSLLMDRSEFVDTRTNRAWRTRRVENSTEEVRRSSLQKSPRHQRRAASSRATARMSDTRKVPSRWVDVTLPHNHIRDLDAAAGDKVEVIRGRTRSDVLADSPDDVRLQSDKGRLKIHQSAISVPGLQRTGFAGPETPEVVVSYRYGTDESANDTSDGTLSTASSSVPSDIRGAVAKLVAADLFETDELGEIFRTSGGDDVDYGGVASSLREQATATINEYRRVG